MDTKAYTTLAKVLQALKDPRDRHGIRYPWFLLLTLLDLAMVSGQKAPHAIADWVRLNWDALARELQPPQGTCPSESIFRRALRRIDIAHLETLRAHANLSATTSALEKNGWRMKSRQRRNCSLDAI